MKKRYLFAPIMLVLVLVTALTGCAGAAVNQPDPTATGGKTTPRPEVPELRLTQTMPAGLEQVQPTESNPIVGEVPAKILDEIIADLIERTGFERQEIEVVRAETVVWNDGSLGCPKPGEFYIQVLMSGYWVVLDVYGEDYDYRANDSGYFFLCEGKGGPTMPTSNPGVDIENPLVIQAKEDLAGRLGISPNHIALLSYEEVVWPDASLGCPQPGMAYIQVSQDGALIRLSVEGQVYDYHSGGNRDVFLCEQVLKVKTTSPKIDIVKRTPPPRDTGDQ